MSEDQDNLKQVKALKQAYNRLFNSEDGKVVLEDLTKVCFGKTTTINEMPHVMAANEGQRMVILHINSRMRLDTVKLEEETK